LEARVRELEARLAELEDRLRANSSNSSTAPSSDPLWAPRLSPKKPTGKKPGGQKGHRGHHRTLLPVEDVDEVVRHVPRACAHCRSALSPTTGDALELRGRHQVAELPPRAVVVTEHQSYACRCGRCGRVTTQPIPPPLRARCTGERLDAALCYLSAFVHGSRRAVEEVAGELLGCPLSLGTVVTREAQMTAALAAPYEQVQAHVRRAPAKNVDETGWKRAGRWLWVAATPAAALFRIDRGRNWHGLQNLLGELVRGTICSDRHGTYDRLKLSRRAVCWAHLKRDFQRWVDRGGDTAWLGDEGLSVTAEVCRLWRRHRAGRIKRPRLRRLLVPVKRRVRALLRRGVDCGVKKARFFCRNIAKVYDALWTFARVEGIEPTNNHAERMLRPAVIWRKKCFGSHSAGGCRYAERMLSVIQTLRLRGRGVLAFLTEAVRAHRHTLPAPGVF
jgi:transposase